MHTSIPIHSSIYPSITHPLVYLPGLDVAHPSTVKSEPVDGTAFPKAAPCISHLPPNIFAVSHTTSLADDLKK